MIEASTNIIWNYEKYLAVRNIVVADLAANLNAAGIRHWPKDIIIEEERKKDPFDHSPIVLTATGLDLFIYDPSDNPILRIENKKIKHGYRIPRIVIDFNPRGELRKAPEYLADMIHETELRALYLSGQFGLFLVNDINFVSMNFGEGYYFIP